MMERPQGVYFGLETGKTYWCYVEQDAAQLKKDQDSNKVGQPVTTEGVSGQEYNVMETGHV